MPRWFLSRHQGAGSQPGKRLVCVIFFAIVRRKFGSGHGNGNKIEFSSSPVPDFCGGFDLLFLLAVRFSFST